MYGYQTAQSITAGSRAVGIIGVLCVAVSVDAVGAVLP